ncbi:hypothetical protein BRAO375_4430001 [Bradyrhizobium sp. ORS 375]|nr:hypothetical protein BRAO375_4430001 [Bradyrhizobium sp. ORS 375]
MSEGNTTISTRAHRAAGIPAIACAMVGGGAGRGGAPTGLIMRRVRDTTSMNMRLLLDNHIHKENSAMDFRRDHSHDTGHVTNSGELVVNWPQELMPRHILADVETRRPYTSGCFCNRTAGSLRTGLMRPRSSRSASR